MPDFRALPIKDGVGPVHLNRFRISMRPPRNDPAAAARIGSDLFTAMVQYMDRRTASVTVDDHSWNGDMTLLFRGVAKFRPFVNVPVTIPLVTPIPLFEKISVPIPDDVRDLMIPDVHTDSVGAVFRGPTSITVQTLKREFQTADDLKILSVIMASVSVAPPMIPAPVVSFFLGALGELAIFINQHHFLAGRRSFHFDQGSAFGYTDGRLVFETAAIERFSLTVYEVMTETMMGSAPDVVRPLWIQMARRVASVKGLDVIVEAPQPLWTKEQEVHFIQQELNDISEVTSNSQWIEMNRLHPHIFDP
jgi:hypothetical protein